MVEGALSLYKLNIPISIIKEKRPILVCWSPPSNHCWKLNVDGSSKCNVAGGGGIFRNMNSEMLMAFLENLGLGDCDFAEISAFHTGLLLCYHFGIDSICVETDSQNLCSWFKDIGKPPWTCWQLWAEIMEIADWISIDLYHIYREQNDVADKLAKLGAVGASTQYFHVHDLPKEVYGSWLMDVQAVPSWRFQK